MSSQIGSLLACVKTKVADASSVFSQLDRLPSDLFADTISSNSTQLTAPSTLTLVSTQQEFLLWNDK